MPRIVKATFQAAGLALGLLLAAPVGALAVADPKEMLADPAQEARAEQIGSQLRCLVCQNESIEDSHADLAHDLRALVRTRVQAGDSDAQVIAWMVSRYGNFIRLRPPLTPATLLLWGTPVLALMIGISAALLGRRRAPPPASPLSAAEATRLRDLTSTP